MKFGDGLQGISVVLIDRWFVWSLVNGFVVHRHSCARLFLFRFFRLIDLFLYIYYR